MVELQGSVDFNQLRARVRVLCGDDVPRGRLVRHYFGDYRTNAADPRGLCTVVDVRKGRRVRVFWQLPVTMDAGQTAVCIDEAAEDAAARLDVEAKAVGNVDGGYAPRDKCSRRDGTSWELVVFDGAAHDGAVLTVPLDDKCTHGDLRSGVQEITLPELPTGLQRRLAFCLFKDGSRVTHAPQQIMESKSGALSVRAVAPFVRVARR